MCSHPSVQRLSATLLLSLFALFACPKPKQFTNLVSSPEHREVVDRFKARMAARLRSVRDNDLPSPQKRKREKGELP